MKEQNKVTVFDDMRFYIDQLEMASTEYGLTGEVSIESQKQSLLKLKKTINSFEINLDHRQHPEKFIDLESMKDYRESNYIEREELVSSVVRRLD